MRQAFNNQQSLLILLQIFSLTVALQQPATSYSPSMFRGVSAAPLGRELQPRASTSPKPDQSDEEKSMIVGIVFGLLGAGALLAGLVYCYYRSCRNQTHADATVSMQQNPYGRAGLEAINLASKGAGAA